MVFISFFKKYSCRMSCFVCAVVQWKVEVSSPKLSTVECFYSGFLNHFVFSSKVLVASFSVNPVSGQTRKRTQIVYARLSCISL